MEELGRSSVRLCAGGFDQRHENTAKRGLEELKRKMNHYLDVLGVHWA